MNLIEFLEDCGLETWTRGKNVQKGHVNIQCPFPWCDDDSNHCGIHTKTFKVRCWKCGKHSFKELVSEIATSPTGSIKNLIRDLKKDAGSTYIDSMSDPDEEKAYNNYVKIPVEAMDTFPPLHKDYLRGRGFNARKLIKLYKLLACHNYGYYKFRIIIPIFLDGKLVAFTSRDVTGEQDPPYLHGSPKECLMSVKNTIYNYDSIIEGGDVIIMEGPADVWKIGTGGICIFGVSIKPEQATLLLRKRIRTAFILLDNDKTGQRKRRVIGKEMGSIARKVEMLTLTKKNDAGELTLSEAEMLKSAINFNRGAV